MDAPFVWPVRVYYEDTDASNVVYYANYLRFMERARSEWLRFLGFEQDVLKHEAGIVFAVRTITIEYLKPAHFNDLLEVTCFLEKFNPASFLFAQEVRYPRSEASPLCVGKIGVVCVDAVTFRPRRPPANLVSEIRRVQ